MARKRKVGQGHMEPCHWCGRAMVNGSGVHQSHPLRATVDHVTPRYMGGQDINNTVLCCNTCNRIKGNMPPDVWEKYRENNPRWWEKKNCHGIWRVW